MPSAERWAFDAEAAQQQRGDRLHDYCLWPYEPINSVEGKWRASTLLRHSFDCYGASAAIYQLCAALQQGLGVGQTVWGIKWVDGAVSWEFLTSAMGLFRR